MTTVGVIPAAGHATRLQPLRYSKEVYPIHGRPVIDHLVERMLRAGCTELRIVTRPEKRDVVDYCARHRATAVLAHSPTPAASLLAGLAGLAEEDIVLFGYPDSIWEPLDGFSRLVSAVQSGWDVGLGLFRTGNVVRPDVVETERSGPVARIKWIDVGSDIPPPQLIWGCAAARARAFSGLRDHDDPGDHFSALCGGRRIGGVFLSESYVDIGTPEGIRIALESRSRLAAR